MEWLNYHHLFYFWTVAREGSVSRGARKLRLAQPTVSKQIKLLETALGAELLVRKGSGMTLTDRGRFVLEYAERIFSVGRELVEGMNQGLEAAPRRFVIGVADVVPKLVTHRLLGSVVTSDGRVSVVFREGHPERLLADLSIREVDLVLTDAPIPAWVKVDARNHLLGECGVAAFAIKRIARPLRRDFPRSLHEAPVLLPAAETMLGRELTDWFRALDVSPRVVSRFDDSALLKVFGGAGSGLFFGPDALTDEICRQYDVEPVGETPLRERYYAITTQDRVTHEVVVQVTEAARQVFPKRRKTDADD